jgi:hypothetical protein
MEARSREQQSFRLYTSKSPGIQGWAELLALNSFIVELSIISAHKKSFNTRRSNSSSNSSIFWTPSKCSVSKNWFSQMEDFYWVDFPAPLAQLKPLYPSHIEQGKAPQKASYHLNHESFLEALSEML